MDDKQLLKQMRAAEFREHNGRVLRAINILRHKYEKLAALQDVLSGELSEGAFLDSVNFLAEEGYISLRDIHTKTGTHLADTDYIAMEAKLTSKGIRLLGGEILDRMVKA